MEGHIALWMWIAAAAFFITGLLMGIAFGRSGSDSDLGLAQRVKDLEAELQKSQEESATYREQVAQHFTHTADLLHTMTANYRAVYEHLADGAQNLCAGQVRSLTPAALRERLLSTNHKDATEADSQAASQTGTEQTPPPEQAPNGTETTTASSHQEKHEV